MMPRGWEAGKPAGLGDRVTLHLRRHLFKTPSLPAISGRVHTRTLLSLRWGGRLRAKVPLSLSSQPFARVYTYVHLSEKLYDRRLISRKAARNPC